MQIPVRYGVIMTTDAEGQQYSHVGPIVIESVPDWAGYPRSRMTGPCQHLATGQHGEKTFCRHCGAYLETPNA